MNKFICLFFMIVLLSACENEKKIHEAAIAEFVQTDRKGVWTDLKFQVIEMSAPYYITVEDSLNILNQEFDAQVKVEIESTKDRLSRYRLKFDKEEFKSIKKIYQEALSRDQRRLDSLEQLVYIIPEIYKNKNNTDVIAVKIDCAFSIWQPLYNVRQEMKETFILNANGDKCLRYLRYKSN